MKLQKSMNEIFQIYSIIQKPSGSESVKVYLYSSVSNSFLYFISVERPCYKRYANTCIYQSPNNRTWNASRSYCQSISGDLVKVENDGLQNYIARLGGGDAWIGLRRDPSDVDLNRFFWTDGSEVSIQ